jgi:hypothetical protein
MSYPLQARSREELLAELEDSEGENITLVAPPTLKEYDYIYNLWQE